MYKRALGFAAAAVLTFGMLAPGPVALAQSSAPCAVPGEGPRDGTGQGQGLRDGKGNGPRNGQGYGPRFGMAQGARDGSGREMKQGRGRGLRLRDGSCVTRGVQPRAGQTQNR
jgi:hypothetical protein